MQVVGLDLRHSLSIHREIIWVTRLAGSSSFGARKVLYFMGGLDNWFFPKVDESIPIDPSQGYAYQASGVPLRGFYYNARNGSSFALLNTEVRVPLFRYLINRPIRSDLIQNFQIVGFADAGTAWTGSDPYSSDNSFNQQVISRNPLTITINNQREPILWSYGFGLHSRVLGYFVRGDWAWGVDDGVIQKVVFHFSLGLDI
jgi:outer membrane protein assembly factor BamA